VNSHADVSDRTTVSITMSLFHLNEAGGSGGAIYSPQSDSGGDFITVLSSIFLLNFAADVGDHMGCIGVRTECP
jgi:predicted outer membrane repeat protein